MQNRPEIWNSVPVPYSTPASELIRLARGPSPDCWAAFVALAHSRDESALAFLRESAGSTDPHVRRVAVEAMGVHQDGASLAPVVTKLIQDTHPAVVRSACEAAGRQRLLQAHDAVALLLDSSDGATRRVAAQTLRSLWLETDLARLIQTVTSDSDPEVRKEAAWTLRATATAATWRQLFEVWYADSLARHRGWAAELAGAFGDSEVLLVLGSLANDVDGHVRRQAAQAMREIVARAKANPALE
jgi:HEAT repeat protein